MFLNPEDTSPDGPEFRETIFIPRRISRSRQPFSLLDACPFRVRTKTSQRCAPVGPTHIIFLPYPPNHSSQSPTHADARQPPDPTKSTAMGANGLTPVPNKNEPALP